MWFKTVETELCCGLLQFGTYRKQQPTHWDYWGDKNVPDSDFIKPKGNELNEYSYGHAEFTDDPAVKEVNELAYAYLCDKFDLVFQSEPRINKNHSAIKKNKVFICIFKKKANKK